MSPLPHESAVGCHECAGNELMITQCDVLSLLREMVMTCGGKTGLKGSSESFWGFPAIPPAIKCEHANRCPFCDGALNTKEYGECR